MGGGERVRYEAIFLAHSFFVNDFCREQLVEDAKMMTFLTPWGYLTLEELYELMMKANGDCEFDQRDEIERVFDTCAEISRSN